MRRNQKPQNLEAGQDSFLDVVSNIVGILIILVVLVGAQVQQGLTNAQIETVSSPPSTPQTPDPNAAQMAKKLEALEAERTRTQAAADVVQSEMLDLDAQQKRLDAECDVLLVEREQLGTYLATVQRQMESFTDQQDIKKKEILLLHRKLLEHDETLAKLKSRHDALTAVAGQDGGPKTIEHKQTPIIRSVETEEYHFIVQDRCVAFVPLDALVQEYQRRLQQVNTTLLSTGSRTDIIGPMDGFSLYAEAKLEGTRLNVFWRLQPPDIQTQGETLPAALAPVSKFRHVLEKLDPKKDILTFWIYPSGFAEFLELKKEAYRLGFSVASRPLPNGMPIAGSPYGQQSVSQ